MAAYFPATPLTLDQLAALSEEIAALARAGVPLDRGLRELGRELPGRLGKVAAEVSGGLAAGKALDAVVAELGTALPPAYRSAVVLRHVDGLSYPDMASALDRPEGTVKAQVHRGLAMLRTAFEADQRREREEMTA